MGGADRLLLGLALAAGGALLPLPLAGAQSEARPAAVVDLHVDVSYQTSYRAQPFERGTGQYVASELVRAGVAGVVLPLYIPRNVSEVGPRLADLEWSYARLFEGLSRSSTYQLPGCRPKSGRVQTWLSFEGAAPLANDPARLVGWVARGLRLVGLVHSYDNALATSAGLRPGVRRTTHGLTPEGREVVRRAHALGAVVDVSHASDAATDEVLRLAAVVGAPVVASHSNSRAVYAHARNVTDAQARAIAASGGVVGVNFHSGYLAPGGQARLADVVRHVLHFARLVGTEHVAIGSDFEGGIRPPPGLENVAGFPTLATALLDSGLSQPDVGRILSGNALRVLCGSPPATPR